MSDYGINIGSRRSRNVITPTFSRDFVTNNTLNHGVGPNITFTRASSATVFTSTGILSTVPNDVPRFEYGDFRTNYRTFSQDFDQWSPNQLTVTANNTTDPIGTSTADRVIENTDPNTFHVVSRSITIPFAGPFTYSVFVKPNGRNSIYVELYNDPSVSGPFGLGTRYSYFNLTGNGSIFTTLGNITPSISALSNGWYRCSITSTALSSSNTLTVVGLASSNSSTFAGSYTGDGSSGVFLWGAQVETGLSATSYIPTTTTAVTTGVPRGLLIEESRTNSIYNSQAIGAIVGAPGTMPIFGWDTSGPSGINREIVNTGTLNGFSYIDIKFSGTCTQIGSNNIAVRFNSTTQLSALPNQTWTGSCYVGVLSGSTANISNLWLSTVERDSAGTFLQRTQSNNISGVELKRYTATRTLIEPTASFVNSQIELIGIDNGDVIDITLRIAAPQLEQGTFPTSYIPTAGLSATRSADFAYVNTVDSFYNQEQGTLFAEIYKVNSPSDWKIVSFTNSSNTTNNITLQSYADAHGFTVWNNGVSTTLNFTNNSQLNTIYEMIGTYKLGNTQAAQNSILTTLNTTRIPPYNINRLSLGSLNGSQFYLNNYLRKITYWPTRLSNNRLRLITS
jgi:hypothetical protein